MAETTFSKYAFIHKSPTECAVHKVDILFYIGFFPLGVLPNIGSLMLQTR